MVTCVVASVSPLLPSVDAAGDGVVAQSHAGGINRHCAGAGNASTAGLIAIGQSALPFTSLALDAMLVRWSTVM